MLKAYELVPFEPEPLESMLKRFPAALCQIPTPPTRQFTFDFECNARMIASLETGPYGAHYIHLSFGKPPWNTTISNLCELQAFAHETAFEFVGLRLIWQGVQTAKAYHLFYEQ